MHSFFISQVLAGLAIIFDLISFQFKNRKLILISLFISGLLIAAHFALLSQWTAMSLMVIGAMRYLLSMFTSEPRIKWVFYVLTIAATAFTFDGITSIFSCLGSLLHTQASFTPDDKLLRIRMLVGTAIWGLHDAMVGSPTAVLMDLLFIISCCIGYYRYHVKPCSVSF